MFYLTPATIYYLPGTVGWDPTFGDRPTAVWRLPQPMVLTLPPDFGVKSNAFGFRISWATNATVVVEASASLLNPAWLPISTNTLTMDLNPLTDGWCYVSDPQWTNSSARFYRIRSP